MPQDVSVDTVLAPEYWGGMDIGDPSLFGDITDSTSSYLEYKKLKFAREQVQLNVARVAMGQGREISFEPGTVFNTDLGEGSLVVLDMETLAVWDNAEAMPETDDQSDQLEFQFTKPYVDLWLQDQDESALQIGTVGMAWAKFPERLASYARALKWGVIVEQYGDRYIQPFPFTFARLLPDKKVIVPPFKKNDLQYYGRALQLPIRVGEAIARKDMGPATAAIGGLQRVRSVDVVVPLSGRHVHNRGKKSAENPVSPFYR